MSALDKPAPAPSARRGQISYEAESDSGSDDEQSKLAAGGGKFNEGTVVTTFTPQRPQKVSLTERREKAPKTPEQGVETVGDAIAAEAITAAVGNAPPSAAEEPQGMQTPQAQKPQGEVMTAPNSVAAAASVVAAEEAAGGRSDGLIEPGTYSGVDTSGMSSNLDTKQASCFLAHRPPRLHEQCKLTLTLTTPTSVDYVVQPVCIRSFLRLPSMG